MEMKKLTKRFVTLIEMMIVMFLIALITGVIAYNYRGSLEEGKAFKTKAGIEKLETILNLEAAKHPELYGNIDKWEEYIQASPLVSNAQSLSTDGWGKRYDVGLENGKIVIRSENYENYIKTHHSMFGGDEKAP